MVGRHGREEGLGAVVAAKTGFKIASDPDTVRAPGTAFLRKDRIEAVGGIEGYWPGAPDLAAEVVSPNDRFCEVEEKVEAWLGARARMILVVDPRSRTATVRLPEKGVRILTDDEMVEGGEVVPGWTPPVADVLS